MSKAENLLDSLTDEQIATYVANSDSEEHIVVGEDRFIYVPDSLKRIAVQFDHNIETVTFDCPRYWDRHDMSQMVVYINYSIAGGVSKSYKADNVRTDENDPSIMHFEWTISREVTQLNGSLNVSICVKKVDETTGEEQNHWNSEINRDMYVSPGKEGNVTEISVQQPDLVSQLYVKSAALDAIIGDLDSALDGIIALQDHLIGYYDYVVEQRGTEGLTYELAENDDGEYYICTGIGTATDPKIVIATQINGIRVTEIAPNAFSGCDTMVSVVIPEHIKTLGESAFEACTSLEYIYFNAVDMNAVADGEIPFYSVGTGAYRGTTLIIGKAVSRIPEYLFFDSEDNLTRLKFEEGSVCTSIDNYAFYGCSRLVDIEISDSVENIGSNAFQGTGASKIAFGENSRLTSIGDYAFVEMQNLTSITLPDSLLVIGSGAFADCTSLESINIPENVTSIGVNMLTNCTSLEYVYYDAADAKMVSVEHDPIGGNLGSSLTVMIGPTVIKIPSYIFSFSKTTAVEFEEPSACTYIGTGAFSSTKLKGQSINIPGSVERICASAFSSSKVSEITFAHTQTLTTIDSGAFLYHTASSIVIPAGVGTIGSTAFAYTSTLTEVKFLGSPSNISSSAFIGCSYLTRILVPWKRSEAHIYEANAPWGATNATIEYYLDEEGE